VENSCKKDFTLGRTLARNILNDTEENKITARKFAKRRTYTLNAIKSTFLGRSILFLCTNKWLSSRHHIRSMGRRTFFWYLI